MDEMEERIDKSLSEYQKDKQIVSDELHPYLEILAKLDALKDVPERDPEVQAFTRGVFLEQARSMPTPVSKTLNQRLNGWITFFRRERSPMTTILGFVLALVVAFGGAGTTTYAAQDSLPNESLYPVKQFTENILLALTTETEAEVHLLLDFSEERMGEMMALASQGAEVPEETQQRLQEHIQLALTEATRLGDDALMGVLQRMQTMAQNQIQAMQQVQEDMQGDPPCEALQMAIMAMTRVRQDAEEGLEDPVTFRMRHGKNRPEDAPDQPEMVPPGPSGEVEMPSGGGVNGQGHEEGTDQGSGANGNGDYYDNGTGDGGTTYGDGDGVCDCTCDDPNCDCATGCMPHDQHNGKMDSKGGKGK